MLQGEFLVQCSQNYDRWLLDVAEYATLYGELVTEWLSSEQKPGQGDDDSEMKDDFEHLRREEQLRDAGRAEW